MVEKPQPLNGGGLVRIGEQGGFMVVAKVQKPKVHRKGYRPAECEYCHQEMDKRTLKPHLRFACTAVPRQESEGSPDIPPGSTIGSGAEAHKKKWTWSDFERLFPRSTWITETARSNPPGGITWNGLHIELIVNQRGCFLTHGPQAGTAVEYVDKIPPPHWNIYIASLDADRAIGLQGLNTGIGTPVTRQVGVLEPQVFLDRETGERISNPY